MMSPTPVHRISVDLVSFRAGAAGQGLRSVLRSASCRRAHADCTRSMARARDRRHRPFCRWVRSKPLSRAHDVQADYGRQEFVQGKPVASTGGKDGGGDVGRRRRCRRRVTPACSGLIEAAAVQASGAGSGRGRAMTGLSMVTGLQLRRGRRRRGRLFRVAPVTLVRMPVVAWRLGGGAGGPA
jgi:hypothetical protein